MIPIIKVSSDNKLSNEQMIQKLIDTSNWLCVTLFGERSKDGKLVKDEYKDKSGKVVKSIYHVGLLQKFEGAYDQDGDKKILLQPGMEQLWQELRERFDDLQSIAQLLGVNQKIITAMVATILKVSPKQWFDLTADENQEMNNWMTNYDNLVAAQMEKEKKEAESKAEELKDLKPNLS